jgi:DNA-binding NarL/FixJ family response regulator
MRVAIVDDALLIREGLSRLLGSRGVDVVTAVGSLDELRPALDDGIDLVILDIRLPPDFRTEGLQAAAELARDHPDLPVLVLSQYREPEYARSLLAGATAPRGYLLKESILQPDQLLSVLYRVAAGQTVVDAAIVDSAIAATPAVQLGMLSPRELEILRLIAEGLTDRGISERLFLSARTVATHIRHIFSKLALPDSASDNRRVQAVLTYLASTVALPAPYAPPPAKHR